MKKCVVGFVFNADLSQVLLIRKTHPAWQAGKLNGPGGKIEGGETGQEAVVREIEEETGLRTKESDWSHIKTFDGREFTVQVLACIYSGDQSDATTQTDEEIGWFEVGNYGQETLYNISELVALSKEKLAK